MQKIYIIRNIVTTLHCQNKNNNNPQHHTSWTTPNPSPT
nr:MAG TPA: hypothetical protein [Caudoviricetes sp.]